MAELVELDDKMKDVLRRIAGGQMSFEPNPDAPDQAAELERFQDEADDIMTTLDLLIEDDLIGTYTTHEEGTGKIDRILITWGLTPEGQELARQLREGESRK